MADVLYLLLTLVSFAAFVLLVRGCAAIVGDDEIPIDDEIAIEEGTGRR